MTSVEACSAAEAAVLSPEETSPPSRSTTSPQVEMPPVMVTVSTLSGREITVEISPSRTVRQLADLLAPALEVAPSRVSVLRGSAALEPNQVLADCDVGVPGAASNLGSEVEGTAMAVALSVLVLPPVPEWADAEGLSYEHTYFLRQYFAKHGFEEPAWLSSDEEIWNVLKAEKDKVNVSEESLYNWNHRITLSRDGVPNSVLRSKPGQTVRADAVGRIWNKNGDSCIHQLLLVMDATIVAELSDGVPGRGNSFHREVSFVAPDEPGVYMLWKQGDLQYHMRDARRNCENAVWARVPQKYPAAFVAWLVVE